MVNAICTLVPELALSQADAVDGALAGGEPVGALAGLAALVLAALTARAAQLTDTEIVHLLTLGSAPYAERELVRNFRVNSFFISENVRDIIQEGLGDYTPIFLSDILLILIELVGW